ncbi:tetratricopeptide repeat protein [Kitasatospora sp. NPDC051705]|uniref:tetratricopeptide repeat protein n=1 Tax=Kitasatospora sp. NPDC051705 TaxID=3364057 RepID=UPI0037A8773B
MHRETRRAAAEPHTGAGTGEPSGVSNLVDGGTVHGDVFQAGRDLIIDNRTTAPAVEVRWPVLVGRIPNLAGYFQHRPESEMLRTALEDGGRTAVLGQVVTGTGGVGKTQLAAHYAHQVLQASLTAAAGPAAAVPGPATPGATGADTGPDGDGAGGATPAASVRRTAPVDLVMWVNAATTNAITTAYAQAARAVAPGQYDGQDAEEAALDFLTWLQVSGRRWLIVLDNVPDPAALTVLRPPDTGNGRTVVTTRSRHGAWTTTTRTLLPVDLYSPEEALAYLRSALDNPGRAALRGADTDEQLTALAQDLGHLPIALAQAAAYLNDTARAIPRYRALLADRARRLEESLPDRTGLPDQQQHTIAALWDISIEQADRTRPQGLARPLLELACVLDPDAVPDTVLTTEAARAYLARARSTSTGEATGPSAADGDNAPVTAGPGRTDHEIHPLVPVDQEDAEDVLRVLHRLNLLDHTPAPARTGAIGEASTADDPPDGGWGAVRVHRLVQHAVRDSAPARERRARLVRAAADAVEQAWPDEDHHDRNLAAVLRANTATLTAHAGDHLWNPDGHPVLFRAGDSLLNAGLHATAHWQHLAAAAQHALGPHHPQTLTARSNLATSHQQAGRTQEAIDLLQQVLTDYERVVGPHHPHTLTARNNLASSYRQAGRTQEAIDLLQQVLTDRERVLGAHHPHTLNTRGNLAHAYWQAGRTDEAITIEEQVLTDYERVVGAHHPQTLTARNNLASSYQQAGRTQEAIDLLQQVLTDRENVLGPHHPQTLSARSNLASSYRQAGRTDEAIDLQEQVLTDYERVVGPHHPQTLTTRNNLAHSYRQAGRTDEAIDLQEQVLTDCERTLGAHHPQTLTARSNLASSYRQAGRTDEAIDLQEQVLTDCERTLGAHHPRTLTIRGNLATSYRQAGRTDEAVDILRSVVGGRVRALGSGHQGTAGSRVSLAVTLTGRGRSLLPGDTAGAWRDAAEAVQAVGPHFAEDPGVYGPALGRAYRLAADVLDADGQSDAAAEYRLRAFYTAGAAASQRAGDHS